MLTLGIDPGTATMGWGVVREERGALTAVAYGALTTPAGMPPAERLVLLYDGVRDVLASHQLDAVAVEELFFSRNVTTALAVGQARGVALLAAAQAGIALFEYKPLVVKQTVAGYGGAAKKQMQEMVRVTLGLATAPRPDDTADALAVAICHTYTAPMLRRIAGA